MVSHLRAAPAGWAAVPVAKPAGQSLASSQTEGRWLWGGIVPVEGQAGTAVGSPPVMTVGWVVGVSTAVGMGGLLEGGWGALGGGEEGGVLGLGACVPGAWARAKQQPQQQHMYRGVWGERALAYRWGEEACG